MVDKQEFHRRFLCSNRVTGTSFHDHAVIDRRSTGRHRLGHLFNFYQTHATVRRYRQFFVIAETRDGDIVRIGHIDQHLTRLSLDLLTIDGDCYRFTHYYKNPLRRLIGRIIGRLDHGTLMFDVIFKFVTVVLDKTPHWHR